MNCVWELEGRGSVLCTSHGTGGRTYPLLQGGTERFLRHGRRLFIHRVGQGHEQIRLVPGCLSTSAKHEGICCPTVRKPSSVCSWVSCSRVRNLPPHTPRWGSAGVLVGVQLDGQGIQPIEKPQSTYRALTSSGQRVIPTCSHPASAVIKPCVTYVDFWMTHPDFGANPNDN